MKRPLYLFHVGMVSADALMLIAQLFDPIDLIQGRLLQNGIGEGEFGFGIRRDVKRLLAGCQRRLAEQVPETRKQHGEGDRRWRQARRTSHFLVVIVTIFIQLLLLLFFLF